MAKFTAEDKLQAVKRYLNGNESSYEIAKSLGTD
ncbi:transposase, partial [Schinkia azotoformans]|nr:transposase [Schinkia azotoformans]